MGDISHIYTMGTLGSHVYYKDTWSLIYTIETLSPHDSTVIHVSTFQVYYSHFSLIKFTKILLRVVE